MTELPFHILAAGRFDREQVRIGYSPVSRPTVDELEHLIAAEWDKRLALAQAQGRLLFNGELFRYLDHQIVDSTFTLTVGPTCYRDFVGTNFYNHHRLAKFGWHTFANPIGTTATILTADDRIVHGRRSSRVAYHADHVHTFGGTLEAADRAADGTIDAFDSVVRELFEELGLRREELRDLICVGLIRDTDIVQPELLFETRIDLTEADLVARWETAEARDEHDGLVGLDDAPDAIVPFIQSCGPIAPVAVGALLLHGRHRWGDGWYAHAKRQWTVQ